MRVFGVVGWKNGGKTTLVERLVEHFSRRGVGVSTVKHAHHGFDIDQPGRDSWRHRRAGARQVAVASSSRWVVMTELRGEPEPGLDCLVGQLAPVDLVLVEGYKAEGHARIEAWRAETGRPPLACGDSGILAVACDTPPDGVEATLLGLDEVSEIASFIAERCGLDLHGDG